MCNECCNVKDNSLYFCVREFDGCYELTLTNCNDKKPVMNFSRRERIGSDNNQYLKITTNQIGFIINKSVCVKCVLLDLPNGR